jgi:hypothetical protein
MAVNVPLNDAVKAAGDPAEIDVHTSVRVATAIPAFGILGWALVLYGRDTA